MEVRIFQLRYCPIGVYAMAHSLGFYCSYEEARQAMLSYFDEDEKILEDMGGWEDKYNCRIHTNKDYTYMIDYHFLHINDVEAFLNNAQTDAIEDD